MKPKRAIDEAAKEQREQDILYAALSLFAEQGFHATKMADIAAKIGLSKGTLYLYFANKEDLFRALITRFAATEMMRMIALLDGEEDIDRALVLLYEEMIVILRDSPLPKLIRVLISEAAMHRHKRWRSWFWHPLFSVCSRRKLFSPINHLTKWRCGA